MPRPLCLALPARRSSDDPPASLHWLVHAGDRLDAGKPIARLVGVDAVDVVAPEDVCGTLKALLVDEGARVTAGNPLLTFLPDNDGERPAEPETGLSEEAVPFARPSEPGRVVVAEVSAMKRVHAIAAVGLITLLGLATTLVTTLIFIVAGGLKPLLVGALALSVVALSLLYGERRLHGHDGHAG